MILFGFAAKVLELSFWGGPEEVFWWNMSCFLGQTQAVILTNFWKKSINYPGYKAPLRKTSWNIHSLNFVIKKLAMVYAILEFWLA